MVTYRPGPQVRCAGRRPPVDPDGDGNGAGPPAAGVFGLTVAGLAEGAVRGDDGGEPFRVRSRGVGMASAHRPPVRRGDFGLAGIRGQAENGVGVR